MRAYREILTVDDPRRIVVEPHLPLRKGQRIEIVIIVEGPDEGAPVRRQLIRENGRLVVAALPGERLMTDDEVRRALNGMEW